MLTRTTSVTTASTRARRRVSSTRAHKNYRDVCARARRRGSSSTFDKSSSVRVSWDEEEPQRGVLYEFDAEPEAHELEPERAVVEETVEETVETPVERPSAEPKAEPTPAAPTPPTFDGPSLPQYGDARFDAVTRAAFESGEAFVANVEEARVLWDDGWDFLDVRCEPEVEFFGAVPNPPLGTVGGHNEVVVVSGPEKVRSVPLVTSTSYRYSSEANAKVFNDPVVDAEWLDKVKKEFPDAASAKIVVVCSDGRQRAVAALEMLESAGYEKLVLLKGGFNLYNRGWDGKLKRRIPHGEFMSDYTKTGDVQQFSRGDRSGNANDAIEFGPWVDAFDWGPALAAAGLGSA
jgi:rhodanese-related sulfurtransferase